MSKIASRSILPLFEVADVFAYGDTFVSPMGHNNRFGYSQIRSRLFSINRHEHATADREVSLKSYVSASIM